MFSVSWCSAYLFHHLSLPESGQERGLKKKGLLASRWQHEKILSSPSPKDTESTAICESMSSEKNLKTNGVTLSHQINNKGTTSQWIWEAETQSCHKHHPFLHRLTHYQVGAQSPELLPEEQRVYSHLTLSTPTFKTSTWQLSPRNIWLWRPTGITSMSMAVWGTSRRPVCRFMCPRAQHRSSPLKNFQISWKGDSVPNFKALVWGPEACWVTLWGLRLVEIVLLLSLCLAKTSRCHLFFSFFLFPFFPPFHSSPAGAIFMIQLVGTIFQALLLLVEASGAIFFFLFISIFFLFSFLFFPFFGKYHLCSPPLSF